ncbi:GH12140 [Drosophila grimshawi]|uniref:GH12140 n=1 Tax=Drosophila grimshawi TaxID=7222 RepID=B4JK03_DROGR|nr:GH12140 [Drosophila grimshawi]
MLRKHWGEIEEEGSDITLDKYVPTSGKRPKLGEIRQRGDPLPQDKHSATTGSSTMNNIVSDMLQELGGSTNSSISLSNLSSGQQQILNTNALYGLLDGQTSNVSSNLTSSTTYQNNFDT